MSDDHTALWNAIPSPSLILSADDRIVDMNSAAESFLNASAKSMAGAPVWDRVMMATPLGDALARVRRDSAQLFINHVDVSTGSTVPVPCDVQIGPIAPPGSILMMIEPRRMADRIGRAHHARAAAKSAIGMAEMLAHEIKNPLAGITGAAQLLAMNLDNEDRELTDLIVAETRRIVQLLEQVEQFGDLRKPDKRTVNLHDLLDRARRSALVGFAAHMKIVEDYDPSLPPTWADGDQLLQVFLNLLKNAAEAADPGGGVIRIRTSYDHSLRLRRQDGSESPLPLRVEIVDDGPGLPAAIGDDIFEAFVSGRENGTGLGLALVSKIIDEHDGWIDAESVPGRTVFRIALPVAPKKEETT